MHAFFSFILVLFSYVICFSEESVKAEYIFFGGEILTMKDDTSSPETLAVANGKILFAGNKNEALYLQSDATQWINLQGGALLPGFINTDCNILFQGLSHYFVDLSLEPYRNFSKLKDHLKLLAKKGPVFAMGFDSAKCKKSNPLPLKFLDSLSQEHPIVIINRSNDMAYVNSKALQLGNVSKSSSSPYFLKKKDGRLSGAVLNSETICLLLQSFPSLRNLDLKAVIKQGLLDYVKQGYTTIVDANLGLPISSSENSLKLLSSSTQSLQQLKVHGFLIPSAMSLKNKIPNHLDYFSILGGSFILDGPLTAGFASLSIPYKKRKTDGHLFYSDSELFNKTNTLRQDKMHISFKASGDKAIDQAVRCCEKLQNLQFNENLSFLIRQASLSSKKALESMSKSYAYPAFSMDDISSSGSFLVNSILPSALIEDLDLTKTALKLGARCSLTQGSTFGSLSPLKILQTAVTRKNNQGSIMQRQERLMVDEALKSLTLYPAYQLQQENTIGSLEVGKIADFVILSASPKKVPNNKINTIQVIETWVNGKQIQHKTE